MRLDRIVYDPGTSAGFFEEGLEALGALCERTWHDRLEVVTSGAAAQLWNVNATLHEVELQFAAADVTTARAADREVFPGCPLTFRLAEALRASPLPLERLTLASETQAHPPTAEVAERRWRAQFPDTNRWRLATPFAPARHFSLVVLVRCEIQAIDQHWSLRRLAVSLPDGGLDASLAEGFGLVQVESETAGDIAWPTPEPVRWQGLLHAALQAELAEHLAAIRTRQENYLRRELDRIDDYFEDYARELASRAARSASAHAQVKTAERLAAANAEHARRRADQVARHEIRVHSHLDALLLVAEPAWRTTLDFELAHCPQTTQALFVPRAKRWVPMLGP